MNDKQTTTKGFVILSLAGIINKLLALTSTDTFTLTIGI